MASHSEIKVSSPSGLQGHSSTRETTTMSQLHKSPSTSPVLSDQNKRSNKSPSSHDSDRQKSFRFNAGNQTETEHLSALMSDAYQINIGNRKVDFDVHDPIFSLSKANPN